MDIRSLLDEWKVATHALPWGVQSLCLDTLKLAADGKVSLVYGTNHLDGKPCLFNAISNLTDQGGRSPIDYAPEVVTLFDSINSALANVDVNTVPHRVSEISAEILVHNFGQLKAATKEDHDRVAMQRESFLVNCSPYFEPTDEELLTDWLLTIEAKDATSEGIRN